MEKNSVFKRKSDTIYVTGHINPDTDSIAAATGYAWLLSERDGANAIASRAGSINPQTAFILKWLEIDPPLLVTDASPRFESVMRRLDAVFRDFQTRVEPEDPAQDVPPPPDFDPLAVYDWSVSRAGDEEMCYYDFRGMREPPEGMLEREKHYQHLEETAAAIGMIALVLWLMVKCY